MKNDTEIQDSLQRALDSVISIQKSGAPRGVENVKAELKELEQLLSFKFNNLSLFVSAIIDSSDSLNPHNLEKLTNLFILSLNSLEQKISLESNSYEEYLFSELKKEKS